MIEKYQKFLLFSLIFFLACFLFLLKPQLVFSWYYCNNGPDNEDGGGCGTPCHCGSAWTQYIKENNESGWEFCELSEGTFWYVMTVSELCPTGDVCILGENGLRYGTCDCLFGSIYKMCCVGSTPVNCIRYGDPKWGRGTCPSGSTIVRGTSCPSDGGDGNGGGETSCGGIGGTYCVHGSGSCPSGLVSLGGTSDCTTCCGPSGGGGTGGSCVVYPYNGSCPKTYILRSGCCVCP